MTWNLDIRSKRRFSAKLAAVLAGSTLLVFAASVGVAHAERHGGHGGGGHGGRGGWGGGGYYAAPPVVYGGGYYAPGYYPPPVVYGPGIGIALPGVSIGIQ
jgi:hypothetical protein